jgi:hypothetical protein
LLLLPARMAMAGEVKALLGVHSSKYLFSSEITSLNRQQKSGLAFGLGYAWEIVAKMKLEVQALYGEKGARASLAYMPGETITGTYRNVTIAVPIFVSYRFREGATPYAALGPEFNFVLSHELAIPGYQEVFDLSDNTRKMVFAVNAALGYELPLGRWGLFAELRYNRWLSSLLKGPEAAVKGEAVSFLIGGIYFL